MYEIAPPLVVAPATVPGIVVEFAGFRRRFFARTLDGIIVLIIGAPIAYLLGRFLDSWIDSPPTDLQVILTYGLLFASSVLVGFLYYSISTASRHQATFGKRAFGIYVTDLSGNGLTYERSCVRVLANYLTDVIFLIGYLMQRFTRQRQALHDKVAGTLVLRAHYQAQVPAENWMRNRNQLAWGPSRTSGWAIGALVGVPIALLLIGSFGYFVAFPAADKFMDRLEKDTRVAMTGVITFQVDGAIDSMQPAQTTLRLDSFTLDINTLVTGFESGYGVEVSTNGPTTIYGFETVIDTDGVAVWGNEIMYQGMPVVVDGQVRFAQTDQGGLMDRFLLSPDAIDKALEDGINQALSSNKLIATDVHVYEGVMTVVTMPKPLEFSPRAEPTQVAVGLIAKA